MELETAVRLRSNLVHLVWVDGTYDMVASQQRMKYGRASGTTLGPIDFVGFAESLGATGLRVPTTGELRPVLEAGARHAGPGDRRGPRRLQRQRRRCSRGCTMTSSTDDPRRNATRSRVTGASRPTTSSGSPAAWCPTASATPITSPTRSSRPRPSSHWSKASTTATSPIASVMRHGDFGVGTFNALDGEMVAVDGKFFHLRDDGSVEPVDPDELTPFAAVTRSARPSTTPRTGP